MTMVWEGVGPVPEDGTDVTNKFTIRKTLNSDGLIPSDFPEGTDEAIASMSPTGRTELEQIDRAGSPWEGVAPLSWEGVAPTKHNWGTTDARDSGKTNRGMSAPERKGTSYERAQLVAQEAFAQTPISGRDDGSTQLRKASQLKREVEKGVNATDPTVRAFFDKKAKDAAALEKEGIHKLTSYIMLRESLRTDISEANPSLVEQIWGGAAGGVTHPLNLLGFAPGVGQVVNPTAGKTLAATLAKNFAAGVPLGMVTGAEQGEYELLMGLAKTNPTIADLLQQGVETGAIMAALGGVMHLVGKPPNKPSVASAAKESVDAINQRAADAAAIEPDVTYKSGSPVDFETKPGEQKVDIKVSPKDISRVDLNAKPGKQKVDFDLNEVPKETPLPKINPEFEVRDTAAPIPELPNAPYPELNPEFKTIRPEPKVEKAQARWQRLVDADNKAVKSGEFPTNSPLKGTFLYDPDVTLAYESVRNGKQLVEFMETHFPKQYTGYTKLITRIKEVINPETAVYFTDRDAATIHPDELQWMKDNPDVLAGAGSRVDLPGGGSQQHILFRGINELLGMSDKIDALRAASWESVLHEATHVTLRKAMEFAKDTSLANNPKYAPHRAFYNEAKDLLNRTKAALYKLEKDVDAKTPEGKWKNSENWKNQLVNVDEFLTYAWTNENFRNLLENLPYNRANNILSKLIKAIAKYFEIDDNIAKRVMGLQDKLKEVQGTQQELGESRTRNRNANNVADSTPKAIKYPNETFAEIDRIENAEQFLKYIGDKHVPDLGYGIIQGIPGIRAINDFIVRNFTTTNQTANILRHPVLTYAMKMMNTASRIEDSRMSFYKEFLGDEVLKLGRKDQLTLYKTLVKTQDPELNSIREAYWKADQYDMFLRNQGMPEHLIEPATRVLKVMEHTHAAERGFAASHGREIPQVYGYFPKKHSGTFKFKIVDPNHPDVIKYIAGYKDALTAQKEQTELAAYLKDNNPEGLIITPVERVDVAGVMDNIGQLLSEEALPDHLRLQLRAMEKARETAKQRFELERATHNIGGYIGERLWDDNTFAGAEENNRLLSLLSDRLEESRHFGINTRIINEVIKPLLWDQSFMGDKPRLSRIMNNLVLREMGYDTAKTIHLIDDALQNVADEVFTWINKETVKFSKTDSGLPVAASEISSLNPRAVKKLAQFTTWASSMWNIGLSPPVLLINMIQPALIGIEGHRVALKEAPSWGLSPKHHFAADAAYVKQLWYPYDLEAQQFMHQAKREGLITPMASDSFHIAEEYGARGTQKKIDTIGNFSRNMIEQGTNWSANLYFYHYFKMTRPDLNPKSESFKQLVNDHARSYTGDYTSLATPQSITNMGVVGQLSSNFSKWFMNQSGRYLDDMQDARLRGRVLPLLFNQATMVMVAGVYGMQGVVDYEWWRQFLRSIDPTIELKPFSEYYAEAQKKGKELTGRNLLPDWIKRGAITEINDFITAPAGKSGVDVSGSLRHSPVVQANFVAISTAFRAAKASSAAAKLGWDAAGYGKGSTEQDKKDAIAGLPMVLKKPMEDWFIKQQRGDKFITQATKKGEGVYAQDSWQRNLDVAGFKTKAEREAGDLRERLTFQEHEKKKDSTDAINRILNNLDNPERVKANAEELFKIGGAQAIDQLILQVQTSKFKHVTTYDERKVMEILNSKDISSRKDAIDILKQFQQNKSRKPSLNR